jgi:dihydrofolate synthase/folylpolyglutamate synthase
MTPDLILERLSALHPKAIDLSLDRIRELLDDLGNPERALPPTIHVAGTNGKGSTVAYLRAILEAAGHRVHVYTSPHLAKFNERVVLAGTQITDDAFSAILEECETVNAGRPITLFEITTATALLAFSRTAADVLLLEVGLGGRLDTTNVVNTQIASVITPISMDHMSFLGDTIEQIAFEKAGILRPGIPAVIGPQDPRAAGVIRERAEAVGAPLILWGSDFTAGGVTAEGVGDRLLYRADNADEDLPRPALPGDHQIPNAAIAVTVAKLIAPQLPNSAADRARGMQQVRWPARMQRLRWGPMLDLMPEGWSLWLDGGHNADAGQAIAAHLARTQQTNGGPTRLIIGMLNSKEPDAYLRPFKGVVDQVLTVAIPGEPNALSPQDLADAARSVGLSAEVADDVTGSVRTLVDPALPAGRILIGGSLYLAGVVLQDHG